MICPVVNGLILAISSLLHWRFETNLLHALMFRSRLSPFKLFGTRIILPKSQLLSLRAVDIGCETKTCIYLSTLRKQNENEKPGQSSTCVGRIYPLRACLAGTAVLPDTASASARGFTLRPPLGSPQVPW
jgi:hypothetical protein